jgi:hypothetical protein
MWILCWSLLAKVTEQTVQGIFNIRWRRSMCFTTSFRFLVLGSKPLQNAIPPLPPQNESKILYLDYSTKIENFYKIFNNFVGFPVFAVCAAPYSAAFFIVAARQFREDQSFNL